MKYLYAHAACQKIIVVSTVRFVKETEMRKCLVAVILAIVAPSASAQTQTPLGMYDAKGNIRSTAVDLRCDELYRFDADTNESSALIGIHIMGFVQGGVRVLMGYLVAEGTPTAQKLAIQIVKSYDEFTLSVSIANAMVRTYCQSHPTAALVDAADDIYKRATK
jgi:hypothetical protein